MAILPGTHLGPYEIVTPLGAGGMGEVYRARDTRLGRDVAVKVLLQNMAATAEDRARFKREAKTISSLNHPHICVLYDVGRESETDYLVMELIEGETLARRIAKGPLPTADVLRIGAQIADALDCAHRARLVHRDLKPSNVMLTKSGAKLMDFGLAREVKPPSGGAADATATAFSDAAHVEEPITAHGTTVGTYQYMSPEQLEGAWVDARSDLWALGCVLYEMTTGKRAFDGSSPASIISAIMRDQPREMAELSPLTPPALEHVVKACLEKDPGNRIQTCHDAKLQLTWIADAESKKSVRGPQVGPRGSARGAPRRLWVAAIMLLTVIAVEGWVLRSAWLQKVDSRGLDSGTTKIPILVAEFEGPNSDPSLAAAARQLVMAGIDQSSRFEAVPRDAIRRALANAGRSESTHVDAVLARELAYRNAIKVTIEGRIDRVGNTLSIVLTARDAEDGRSLQSLTGAARGEGELIATIGNLTSRLRSRMGESAKDLVTRQLRWIASTPSFEAYRKYIEAYELQQLRGDDQGSIVLLNDALRIDPDFAESWALKGFAYGHLGNSDSSRFALKEALKRPHRLTEEGRMFLQGLQDASEGDYATADATYRELIRRGYQLSSSLGNHGSILLSAGRYKEALQEYRRAAHINAIGPQQWVLGGELMLLLMFGEVEEARRETQYLKGPSTDEWLLGVDVAAGDWRGADSLAVAILENPIRASTAQGAARAIRMSLVASRGAIREYRSYLQSERHDAEARSDPELEDLVNESLELELLLSTAAGPNRSLPRLEPSQRQSPTGVVVRGLLAAQRDDLKGAEKALQIARSPRKSKSAHAIRIEPLAALGAWLEGLKGHWRNAAATLGAMARQGESPDPSLSPITLRWLAARAFEQCQMPDSAVAYYALALDPRGLWNERRIESKVVSSFAHERLANLYARLGRTAESRGHRQLFLDGFTNPDPEFQRLLGP